MDSNCGDDLSLRSGKGKFDMRRTTSLANSHDAIRRMKLPLRSLSKENRTESVPIIDLADDNEDETKIGHYVGVLEYFEWN